MASITISDLRPAGYDLFSDSESYMKDLSEAELGIEGGITPAIVAAAAWSSANCGYAAVAGGAFVASYVWGRFG